LILHQNKQDANIPHSPEGTNLIFAEGIKRDFSLHDVFPPMSVKRMPRATFTFMVWVTSIVLTVAVNLWNI